MQNQTGLPRRSRSTSGGYGAAPEPWECLPTMKNEQTPRKLQPEVDRRIDVIRRRMDKIDARLVALLNERARCAQDIGDLKEQVDMEVYQPSREIEVLAHVRDENLGPRNGDAITRLFEQIIDEARRLERTPK